MSNNMSRCYNVVLSLRSIFQNSMIPFFYLKKSEGIYDEILEGY